MKKLLRNQLWFFVILTIGLLLRLYNINLPLLDAKPHREIHTAEETRNLYYQPKTLFYPTSKLWADEPGYYIVEFPIYNSLVAAFYFIFGGVNETWGKVVSVIASVGVAIIFYRLSLHHFGKQVALWSTAFMYLVSPQEIILSRSFQPDQLGFFFGLFALYYFSLWIDTQKTTHFLLSWISFALTFLIKISFFPFVFPCLYLVFKKWGKEFFKQPLLWIYATTLIPTLVWYNHVRLVYLAYPQLHSAALVNPTDWLVFQKLLDPHWYTNIFYDFTEQIITVPVGILVVCSIFLKQKYKTFFVYWWIIGVALYALLFIGKIYFWYYQVPFIFPLTLLAGITVTAITKYLRPVIFLPKLSVVIVILAIMLPTAKPYLLRTYTISPRHQYVLDTAARVKRLAPKNSKIIASSHNSAALTYYSLRPDLWGGTFLLEDTSCDAPCMITRLEDTRKWGATLFAISDKTELSKNVEFENYLRTSYKIALETDNYLIIDLIRPLSPT